MGIRRGWSCCCAVMEEDSEESIMEDREGFMEVYSGKNKKIKIQNVRNLRIRGIAKI